MRRFILYVSVVLLVSCAPKSEGESVEQQMFANPLFAGDYPDPSILVDGDDYYVVHSSFEYYPGLTIYHSRDLVNWRPVQSTLHEYVGSVWAPDLCKVDGKYYIYFPANDKNYVIWADSIDGKWSSPIELNIGHIDPGHVQGEDGRRYLYFSSGCYIELSSDGLSTVGELKHSYEGWQIPEEWSIECFCMEGPKIMKRGEYYYLTVAEGGTAGPATGHMVVSARSKSPVGPWENSPYNPIIRAKSVHEKWCSVGHATVFESNDDKWYMMYHGYENGYYNMGRQTLLAPVEWTDDGWFKVSDGFMTEKPFAMDYDEGVESYCLSDDFSQGELGKRWRWWKESDEGRYSLEGGELRIKAKGSTIDGSCPLLCTPEHHSYRVTVDVRLEGEAVGGLALFYSEKMSSGILADSENVLSNLRGWQFVTKEMVHSGSVSLRLENRENIVDMYYKSEGGEWQKIENSLDVSACHHNVLSGFMALRVALVSMGEGEVIFDNFEYEGLD